MNLSLSGLFVVSVGLGKFEEEGKRSASEVRFVPIISVKIFFSLRRRFAPLSEEIMGRPSLSPSRPPSDGDVTCGLNFFGGLPSSSFFVCSIVPRSISRRYAAARAKTTSASDDRLGRPPPSMLRSLFASRSRHGTPYRLQSRVKQW